MRGALSCQVATFPKSGTTFVTNICHQLRSRCEANDFEEITAICPWIDLAVDVGQNLEDDHAHEPRVFKSHMNPSNLNPGGKAIFVVRDPAARCSRHRRGHRALRRGCAGTVPTII